MSDHDDIQLDEETLRQIEEEAMREAQAQLEADEELNRELEEQALRETGGELPEEAPKARGNRKAKPRRAEPQPEPEEYDDEDEEYEDEDVAEEYRPQSNIELLEAEIARKSGRFKIAAFIMLGVILLGAIAGVLIIQLNKRRAQAAENVDPIKVGKSGKSGGSEAETRRVEARQLLAKARAMAGRKNPVAYQIEDGLKFIEKLKKEYPEFCKENATSVDSTEKKLKEKQDRLKNMMNMGK